MVQEVYIKFDGNRVVGLTDGYDPRYLAESTTGDYYMLATDYGTHPGFDLFFVGPKD